MFSSHGIHGFLRKYKLFLAIDCGQFFGYRESSVKVMHSFNQFKQKKLIQHTDRKLRKSFKPVESNDVESKVYMRDIVGNISKILRCSTWVSAQEQLERLPIRWDSYTINQVLKTHPPMEKAWLFFNWASQLKSFKHDQFTYTTMLDIFGEAGRISSMNYVYQQMQEKGIKVDVVTYTSLLHWLSKDGDIDGSVKTWKEMKANGCLPTVVSYTAFMKVLFENKRVKEATDIYKEMLQSGCSPNCYTYTVLMEYLASSGKFKETIEIFCNMQDAGVLPDKATCNILIEKCCKAGETWAMIQILQYMKRNSLVLRYPVFLEALDTLKTAGESVVLLRQVNPHFSVECFGSKGGRKIGSEATCSDVHYTIDRGLVLNLLKKQNFVAVDHLLASGMTDKKNTKLDSWIISTIIEVNCDHCRTDGALLAFEYSVKMGIQIQRSLHLALIGVLIRMGFFPKVVEIVEEMTGAGHSLGTHLAASLIYRLGYSRRPILAAKIFDLLCDDEKNCATYTALIGAYFFCGGIDKGLKIYETMRNEGIHPAFGTYNVLLAGLQKSGRIREMESFRKEKKSRKIGMQSDDIVSMEDNICNLLFAGDVVF